LPPAEVNAFGASLLQSPGATLKFAWLPAMSVFLSVAGTDPVRFRPPALPAVLP
jgi:hypothetical protein